MARDDLAARPTKKNEFVIAFASRSASVGWRDLIATQRNVLADAWDFLTRTPLLTNPKNYELRGELSTVTRNGQTFARWQHKPSLNGDARLWFFVDGQTVYLERVITSHPNQTK